MDYTIGEYSRDLIEKVMKWVSGNKSNVEIEEELSHYFDKEEPKGIYEKIYCLIERIGEPI